MSCNGRSFSFHIRDEECTDEALRAPSSVARKGLYSRLWHDLRDFLRTALARSAAISRPRDFGGLENGWCEDRTLRELQYSLWLRRGGRFLSVGAIWTARKKHTAFGVVAICPRCGANDEFLEHRLYSCPANAPLLSILADVGLSPGVVASIPNCLRRCGIIPRSCTLSFEQLSAWINFLSAVNADATDALVA